MKHSEAAPRTIALKSASDLIGVTGISMSRLFEEGVSLEWEKEALNFYSVCAGAFIGSLILSGHLSITLVSTSVSFHVMVAPPFSGQGASASIFEKCHRFKYSIRSRL